MDKTLREIEVKVADVLWVFGRRGFTDTETVEDSTRKIMYQVQELVKECIPKKKKLKGFGNYDAGSWEEYGKQQGRNQAIEDITKALREKGLL